jgi:hypothetical protein
MVTPLLLLMLEHLMGILRRLGRGVNQKTGQMRRRQNMGKILTRRRLGVAGLAGLLILSAGCNQQDAEAMSRIGKKLASVAGDLKEHLGSGWQGVYNGMGLEARVAARLRWDKSLADMTIHVKATGGEIELKGTVQNAEQRRRAVDLAESTAGVERVNDSLELSGP